MDPERLCAQLAAYVAGPEPDFPESEPRLARLRDALARLRPPPAALRPLVGPRGAAEEVDRSVLKRDSVALCVVDSLILRHLAGGEAPAPLLDVVVEAGLHFSFDPLYGEAHTRTGEEVCDFLSRTPATPDTAAALERHLEPLLRRWRARVTDKSTSTLSGIVLRHLGPAGGLRLFEEWDGMREDERVDLVERAGREEAPPAALLARLAEAVLDASYDVRASALRALGRRGAPVEGLHPSLPEAELRRGLGPVLRWIEETRS